MPEQTEVLNNSAANRDVVLDARDVAVAVPSRALKRKRAPQLVTGVNLQVRRGEAYGLVGESGSGKSTMARAAARLVPLAAGSVTVSGVDLSALRDRALRPHRRRIQMVFQDPYSSLNPLITVGDAIAEGLTLLGLDRSQRGERVYDLLTSVGLEPEFSQRYPSELSGGQRQRVAIARALAPGPELLICDEAVSALDMATQSQILDLLRGLRDQFGLAMLFISHDLSVVRQLCDVTSIMYCGEVVESGPTGALLDGPCHPFSAALLSAAPIPSPREQRARQRIRLDGDMPSVLSPPSGCRFHPRCPIAMDICTISPPPTVPTLAGGQVRCHAHTSGPTLGGRPIAEALPRSEPTADHQTRSGGAW